MTRTLAPYLILFGLICILTALASCEAENSEFQPRAGFVMLAGV